MKIWVLNDKTFFYQNSTLKSKGHSGRWIIEEYNSLKKNDKPEIIFSNLKLKDIYSNVKWIYTLKKIESIQIHGVEFISNVVYFIIFYLFNLNEYTTINLQGFPRDISKKYWIGNWFKFKYFFLYPILSIKELLKYLNYYLRGIISLIPLRFGKKFKGRTDYDRKMIINKEITYEHSPRILRKDLISFKSPNKNKKQIIISQAHYPTKGLHLILNDLIEFLKKNEEYKIIIGGNFNDRNLYTKLLRKQIIKSKLLSQFIFLDDNKNKSYNEYLINSSIFILPSIVENSSNSLLEALSLNIYSIVEDSGGNKFMCKNNLNHKLYSYKNNSFKKCLDSLDT